MNYEYGPYYMVWELCLVPSRSSSIRASRAREKRWEGQPSLRTRAQLSRVALKKRLWRRQPTNHWVPVLTDFTQYTNKHASAVGNYRSATVQCSRCLCSRMHLHDAVRTLWMCFNSFMGQRKAAKRGIHFLEFRISVHRVGEHRISSERRSFESSSNYWHGCQKEDFYRESNFLHQFTNHWR